MPYEAHIVVKFVNQGDAGGYIHPHDVLIGHMFQVFHQGPDAVTVRRDDHPAALLQSG